MLFFINYISLINARRQYVVYCKVIIQQISAYLQGIPKEAAYLKSKEILSFSVRNKPLELTAVQCCGILSVLETLSVLEMLYRTLYVSNEQSL